jgi:chemotaxis protein CheD
VQRIVGVGDMQVSNSRGDVLATYSLGSCVGMSVYDAQAGVGGMAHCMLPLSSIAPEKAKASPAMFADTGIPALLEAVYGLGARRERLVVIVAGGGSPLNDNGMFKIGERNYAVLRKVLWKNGILIKAEDVGGTKPRTMYLHMDTGQTFIKS